MASSKAKSAKSKSSKGSSKQKKLKISKPSLVVPDAWINELSHLDINDENWKCYVALMEEMSTDASVYLEHFNEASIKGRRLAIKVISKLEMIKTVTERMMETNPDKKITPFALLCSEIFNAAGSKFEGKIPVELLAPLIKYILLEYKKNNKQVKDGINEIQKHQEEYRQSLWQINKVKQNSSKGTTSTKRDKNINKSKKSLKGLTKEKVFTKLRKRGEEWKDVSWIDDAPIDGPQLYVMISTFFEPDLPLELLNLDIPLEAIVRLNIIRTPSLSDSSSEDEVPFILLSRLQSLAEFKRKSVQFLSFNIGKHIDSEEIKKIRIKHFWNKVKFLKTNKRTAQLLKNVMFLQFVPEHQDFEYQVQTFQDEIYRQVSYFLYDVFETSKHHKTYLNEIEIISVSDTDTCNLSGMLIYNSILDTIPQEVLGIPLILDALVAQVSGLSISEKNTDINTEDTTKTLSFDSNKVKKDVFELLDSLNLKYDLFGDLNDLLMSENTKLSISKNARNVLIHGDEILIKSFHLESEISQYVRNRTNYILKVGWKDAILGCASFSYLDESFTKLCSEIIKIEVETGHQGLYYFFYILITNSILNSLILTHSGSGYRFNTLRDEITEYNKDISCEKCLMEISSNGLILSGPTPTTQLKSSVSCSDGISTYSLSDDVVANNLFYIEEMSPDILLQRIQNVAHVFSDVELRKCSLTDQTVVLFHNLVNPRTLDIERKWMGKITTKIPIRDFVDYIINEEEDWLKKQSLNLGSVKQTRALSSSMHEFNPRFTLMLADLDYISHRSIKYHTMIKQHSQTNSSSKILKVKGSKSKSPKKSNSRNSAKNSKKNKDDKVNQEAAEFNSSEEIQPKTFNFLGYDLGDPIRFQYNGWRKDIILDDDCKIILKSTKLLYGEESRSANVHIFGNDLYLHFNPNNTPGHCLENSFHLILRCGILLYFLMHPKDDCLLEGSKGSATSTTKQHYIDTLPKPMDQNSSQLINTEIEDEKDINIPCSTIFNDYQRSDSINYKIHKVNYSQIPTTFDLKLSMPSGLHTELVKYENMLYVRQTLLTKGPLSNTVKQEKYRCCLPGGYIIKFMLNGDFEILCGNGEIFNILKYTCLQDDLISKAVNLVSNGIGTNLENNLKSNENSASLSTDNNAARSSKNQTNAKKQKGTNESEKQNRTKKSNNNIGKLPSNQEDHQLNSSSTKTIVAYSNYKFTESNGDRFLVQNGLRENLPSLFMSSWSDISINCINSERIDGVKSKHLADGSLVVEFLDGSRIKSIPIESDELFSLWTPDEFDSWYADLKDPGLTILKTESIKTNVVKQTLDKPFPTSNNIIDVSMMNLSDQKGKQRNDVLGIDLRNSSSIQKRLHSNDKDKASVHLSIKHNSTIIDDTISQKETIIIKKPNFVEDSFVVFNMSYLMEHPNYGSVFYDAHHCEIKFELPVNTHITLKRDGSYVSSFEGAIFNVYNDSLDFSRIKNDRTLRTITINTTRSSTPASDKILSPLFDLNLKLIRTNKSNSNPINNEQTHIKSYLENVNPYGSFFLYSTDPFRKEIFIDYDFNCYEIPTKNTWKKTVKGNDFSVFVINNDLSGFRLISDDDVDNHLANVTKENGFVIKNESKWSSLLSILPVNMDESERWLFRYNKKVSELPILEIRSTFGKRESWIFPFVEPDNKESQINITDAVILRLLHRIPTDKNTLSNLTSALEMFKKSSKNSEIKKINHKEYVHDLNWTEILTDPNMLINIYNGEVEKRTITQDKFRTCLKEHLLLTLVHQACIKARKGIIKYKENELKTALRIKKIPPYHLSSFGQVREILGKVVENVTTSQKKPSNSSVYERVNCIIDEVLEFSVKFKSNTSICYSSQSELKTTPVEGIIDEIFQKIWTLKEENITVNRILEKPLQLVNTEEIECLCSRFGPGSIRSTFYIEGVILKDILEARLQLSHYFYNLKEMLLYYKSKKVDSEIN